MSAIAAALLWAQSMSVSAATPATPSSNVYLADFLNEVEKGVEQTPELAKDKAKIAEALKALRAGKLYSGSGSDASKRPAFVGLQQAVEHILYLKKKANPQMPLIIVYHTPAPPTPLCTPVDAVADGLIDPSLKDNPAVRYTVASRAKTVRNLIDAGAQVYSFYEHNGAATRSPEQRKIFEEYAHTHPTLRAGQLDAEKMDPMMVGATYVFVNDQHQTFGFFIKASQANKPSDDDWQLGVGLTSQPQIHQRIDTVLDYLAKEGRPAAKEAIYNLTH